MFKILLYCLSLLLIISANLQADSRIVNQTGTFNLMWQDDEDAKSLEKIYHEAVSYCENLELGNYTDWRLPSVEELLYIADKKKSNPSIHSPFINVVSKTYWTSTPYINGSSNSYEYFGVDFKNGNDTGEHDSSQNYVRCVRGEKAVFNFSKDSSGSIVSEANTGIMFQNKNSSSANKFTSADSKCKSLELNEYTDWRVPTFEELYLLLNSSTNYNLIGDMFEDTSSGYTWTSDKYLAYSGSYWFVAFKTSLGRGFDNAKAQNSYYILKCVRGNSLEFNFSLYDSSSSTPTTTKQELKSGWSMISSIVNGKKYKTSLFDASVVYSYNPKTSKFYNPEYCKPSFGCWVKLLSPKTVILDSSMLENDTTISLGSIINNSEPNAWNLVGTSMDTTLTKLKNLNVSTVWIYDTYANAWNTKETVKAGEGFWIKTLDSSASTSSSQYSSSSSSSESSSEASSQQSSSVSSTNYIKVDHNIINSTDNMHSVEKGSIVSITHGADKTHVLKDDNTLWVLGYRGSPLFPIIIAKDVKSIYSIEKSHFFIKTDNSLWAYGNNLGGRLGDGTNAWKYSPVKISENVSSIINFGQTLSFIIKTDRSLWRFGYSNTTDKSNAKPIKITDNLKSIVHKSGLDISIIKNDNSLWWMEIDSKSQFKLTKKMDDAKEIYSNGSAHYVIKTDNTLWAFGSNSSGQLGDGTKIYRPEAVKIMNNVSFVSTKHSTFVIKNDNTLWAFGFNDSGQLGDGTRTDRLLPVKISDNVKNIYQNIKNENTFFVKMDNTLWACGENRRGQLGDGTTTSRLKPVKIMNNVKDIKFPYQDAAFVLKHDNTLWGIGRNAISKATGTTKSNILIPTKIIDNVNLHSFGKSSHHVLKNDDTLWGFGDNSRGQLGVGHTKYVQIPEKTMPFKVMQNINSFTLYNQNSSNVGFKILTHNNNILYGNFKDKKFDSFIMFPKELNGGALLFQLKYNKVKYIYEISSNSVRSIIDVRYDNYRQRIFDIFTFGVSKAFTYEGKEPLSDEKSAPISSNESSSSSKSSSGISAGEALVKNDDPVIYKKNTRVMPLWIAVIGLGYVVNTIDAILKEETIVDRLQYLNDTLESFPSDIEDYFNDKYTELVYDGNFADADISSTPKNVFDTVPVITNHIKDYLEIVSGRKSPTSNDSETSDDDSSNTYLPSSNVTKGTCSYATAYFGKVKVYPGTVTSTAYSKTKYLKGDSFARSYAVANANIKNGKYCKNIDSRSNDVSILSKTILEKRASCKDLAPGKWIQQHECTARVEAYCTCPDPKSSGSVR